MGALPLLPFFSHYKNQGLPGKKAKILSTWDSGYQVNLEAWKVINKQGTALDAVEQAGIHVENEISCCVGLGGNPDRDGKVTLDACIMDHRFQCGSVSFLERIKHPVSLARRVMEKTPHVMLVGKGAQKFAIEEGFPLEKEELSPDAKKNYENWLKESKYNPEINIENKKTTGSFNHDTMGTICLDNKSQLAGMCTTSGMAYKMHGRVGDSPIIGSGLYVDGQHGAATGSGQGEEVIRTCGTFAIVECIRGGKTPLEACKSVINRIVDIDNEKAKKFQVGFIALDKNGRYGAYSIHPGFSYAITWEDGKTEIKMAKSYFS